MPFWTFSEIRVMPPPVKVRFDLLCFSLLDERDSPNLRLAIAQLMVDTRYLQFNVLIRENTKDVPMSV